MKKTFLILLGLLTINLNFFAIDFTKDFYVDRFGDPTTEWYFCSDMISGTSPNSFGDVTNFISYIYVSKKSAYFYVARRNGDTYAGDGYIYVKYEDGETDYFRATNNGGFFYPQDSKKFRSILLSENTLKIVIEISNSNYSFNLGSVSLDKLHSLIEEQNNLDLGI